MLFSLRANKHCRLGCHWLKRPDNPPTFCFSDVSGDACWPFWISIGVLGILPLSRIVDPVPLCVLRLWHWSTRLGRSTSHLDSNKLSSPNCPYTDWPVTKRDAYTGSVLWKIKSSFFKAFNRNSYCAFL